MSDWRSILHYDPLPPLLSSGVSAIAAFTEQDLLGQTDKDVTTLWNLSEAKKIASKQQSILCICIAIEKGRVKAPSRRSLDFSGQAEPAPAQAFFNLIERHFQRTVGQVVIR